MDLPLETVSAAFSIAKWTLFAALFVGAAAAIVMLFTGLIKGRRRDVLRAQFAQTAVVPRAVPAKAAFKSIESNTQTRKAIRSADNDATAAQTAMAAASALSPEIDPTASLGSNVAGQNAGAAEKLVLISRLSRFRGTGLDVFVYSGSSADVLPVARMVSEALRIAGWNVRVWNTAAVLSDRGLLVQTRFGADRTVQDPGVKLMLALQEVGLSARASQPFDPNEAAGNAIDPALKQEMIAPIRLLIGSRV